jgi:hypothetical protein
MNCSRHSPIWRFVTDAPSSKRTDTAVVSLFRTSSQRAVAGRQHRRSRISDGLPSGDSSMSSRPRFLGARSLPDQGVTGRAGAGASELVRCNSGSARLARCQYRGTEPLAECDRPAFQSHPLRGMRPLAPIVVESSFQTFARLALLNAARREAERDIAGALDDFRALFRSSRHVELNNGTMLRLTGERSHRAVCEALIRWARDKRVDIPLLRSAMANANEDDAPTILLTARRRSPSARRCSI